MYNIKHSDVLVSNEDTTHQRDSRWSKYLAMSESADDHIERSEGGCENANNRACPKMPIVGKKNRQKCHPSDNELPLLLV